MIDGVAHLPEPKRLLLERLKGELSIIPGMTAIVLGGSYASGTYHERSDLDIGLYYHEARPFAIADIRRIAKGISASGDATVTDFYEWGAWVNGGAWIDTPDGKVDFLYRNLDQVRRTIEEAHQGIIHHDYDQQPTHGFYSVIYLAETQICIPLYDPDRLIEEFKRQVKIYPQRLKRKIIADTLWSAEFTLLFAHDFATQGDIYNTVGCLTRVAGNLTQALFALNERYFIRDKKVIETLATFTNIPEGYVHRINRILACPGSAEQELVETVSQLEQGWRSVAALAGELYQAKFQV